MTRAMPILSPPARTVTIPFAPGCVMVLAMHYSRKRVIEAAKAGGIRPSPDAKQARHWLISAAAFHKCLPPLERLPLGFLGLCWGSR